MKYAYSFLLIGLFFSCTPLKKSFSKKHSEVDSTSVNLSSTTALKKIDSVSKSSILASANKNTENQYQKSTTIKEYFSDEFDFSDSIKKQPVINKTGGLKYRETVIIEQGKKIKNLSNNSIQEHTASTVSLDSSNINKAEILSLQQENIQTSSNKEGISNLWAIWVIVLFAVTYCSYKELTPRKLWQILTKHIK